MYTTIDGEQLEIGDIVQIIESSRPTRMRQYFKVRKVQEEAVVLVWLSNKPLKEFSEFLFSRTNGLRKVA